MYQSFKSIFSHVFTQTHQQQVLYPTHSLGQPTSIVARPINRLSFERITTQPN